MPNGMRKWMGESENPLPPLPAYIASPRSAFHDTERKGPEAAYWLWAWKTYAELADDPVPKDLDRIRSSPEDP